MIANCYPPGILSRLGLVRERDHLGRKRRGTWMGTYTGHAFWPFDPRPEEVYFDDLCIGLARECRYGNQCSRFYSVSEHVVLVSLLCEKLARARGWTEDDVLAVTREGVLHDASEAWIGDMIRPVKHTRHLRGFRKAENLIQGAVFQRFGVVPTKRTTALVKEVDNRVLVDEIQQLMPRPEMYLSRHEQVQAFGVTIVGAEWTVAAAMFCQRFAELFPDLSETDN